MTITEFLLARIAEDEAVAAEQNGAEYFTDGAWPEGMPARVLAECAAKRAIIDAHRRQEDDDDPGAWIVASEILLTSLAAVYADHPEYEQEWKP